MNFGQIWDVFGIPTSINRWTISIIVILVLSILFGYYLMASQVKIVKKEFWKWSDTLKCAFFGIFFGLGITLIAANIVTFILDLNDLGYQDQAVFLLVPMVLCLIFVSIYPLIEFLFMAHFKHEISATPFQKPFERIIKSLKSPWSYIVAGLLYLLVIPLPPLVLMYAFNVEFLIAWISWQLIYPLLIIIYYASVGYIIAFGIFAVSIPHLSRSTFLHFDKSNRAIKEFFKIPTIYIVFGSLFYSYGYFIYKTIVTLARFNINYVSATPKYNIDWSIPISLGFAISAYFNRYWKRKVKSSTQSIVFSAYLIAALSVNIVINYVIVRPSYFEDVFQTWDLTAVFYNLRGVNSAGINVYLYTQFNLIGVIEELMLFVIISYFFFIQKDHKIIKTTFEGTVTSAEEKFNPVPGFNMIRYKDSRQREFAYASLLRMYRRIPNKRGLNFNQYQFKSSLFDALSDKSFPHGYKISQKLLLNLIQEFPKEMKPLVEEGLTSKNPDMISSFLEVLESDQMNIVSMLDETIMIDILLSNNYYHWLSVLKVLNLKYTQEEHKKAEFVLDEKLKTVLLNLLTTPDVEIELGILYLLSKFPESVDSTIFTSRLNHPNPRIQSAIANVASRINLSDIESLSIPRLLDMVNSVNVEIRASVLSTLAKIKNFEQNNVPFTIFEENICDRNSHVRDAAIQGMKAYLQEKPYAIRPEQILKEIDSQSGEIKKSLVHLLPSIWKQAPSKVFPMLILQLRSDDFELSSLSQTIILEMAQQDPKYVVSQLIPQTETESILKRGKIVDTIIKIAQKYPKHVLPILMKTLSSTEKEARTNAASSIVEFSKFDPDSLSVNLLVSHWEKESQDKIKTELTLAIQNIGVNEPEKVEPFVKVIFKNFEKEKKSLKLTIAKMLVKFAQKSPQIIPFNYAEILVKDSISSIRESGYEVLGYTGDQNPKKALKILLNGLSDEEFGARNESLKSIATLAQNTKNPAIISEVMGLLKDKNKWTRKSALDVLSSIKNDNPELVDLEDILKNIKIRSEDKDVLISLAKWFGNLQKEEATTALEILIQLMEHTNEAVRNSAVSSLVRLSNHIASDILVPKLLSYLSDESSIELEQSVSLVLKKVVKYENKAMKDRVISILTIRAHHTQDKILQQALSELRS